MGETLAARIPFLQRHLHAINLAVAQAKARGDEATVATLREQYRALAAQVEELKREAYAADSPSDLLVALDRFSDETIAVGKEIGASAVNVVSGVSALVKYLPVILLVGLLVVGVFYAAKLRKDLQ